MPKSQVARDAVARYLGAPDGETPVPLGLTARDLARRWATLPRLHPDEAATLGADIRTGRDALTPVPLPWE